MDSSRITFGLVHGGGHSGASWNRLIASIIERGADAVAMDLPCEDLGATIETYAEVVTDALAHVQGPVHLVGHSMAGLTIPLVALQRPVRSLIFLCGTIPNVPGSGGLLEMERTTPELRAAAKIDKQGRLVFNPKSVESIFYNMCDPSVAEHASLGLRPQTLIDLAPDVLLKWPDLPIYYILGRNDRALNPEWSRATASSIFQVPPIEMDSDHSPFLSRPSALADVLLGITEGLFPAGRPPGS
jgi:pimeloyl-ACP methyl ester carboxylesterase